MSLVFAAPGLRIGPDVGTRAGPPSALAPPRAGGLRQPAASGAAEGRLLRTAAALALLQPVRRRSRTARTAKAEASSASYEAVPLEGRGLGAVALRDIARGELVAAERPQLEFVTGEEEWSGPWRDSVREQFDALPEEVQRAVMRLQDAEAESAGTPGSLEGVVRTNSFSRDSRDYRGGVLCAELSRFNHSCAPNCETSWSQACGENRIYASSDVKAGEELCIFYTDTRAPRGYRQAELQARYGFECRCSACGAAGEAAEASDRRRARAGQLEEEIALAVSAEDLQSTKRGLKLCQELLALYDEEGLQTQSFRKLVFYYMFQCWWLLGDPIMAGGWAEKALEAAEMCHGLDHEDTQRLRGYLT